MYSDYPSAFFEHSQTSTIPFCTEDQEILMYEFPTSLTEVKLYN